MKKVCFLLLVVLAFFSSCFSVLRQNCAGVVRKDHDIYLSELVAQYLTDIESKMFFDKIFEFNKPVEKCIYYAEGYLPDTMKMESIKITKYKNGLKIVDIDYRLKTNNNYGATIFLKFKNSILEQLLLIEYFHGINDFSTCYAFSLKGKQFEKQIINSQGLAIQQISPREFFVATDRMFRQVL